MHKYDHHIGDYDRDTGHLSLLEHGVYRRLLDRMYADERPLPADVAQICRRMMARTKPEMDAVRRVLGEFFCVSDDGFSHKRVRREIEANRLRHLLAQYGMVKRFWDNRKWGVCPSKDEFVKNPSLYIDPVTGSVGNYQCSNSPLLDGCGSSNTNLPPSTFHLPPSTSTPKAPKGDQNNGQSECAPELIRAMQLFRVNPVKLPVRLDSAQARAWKKNKGVVLATSDEDWVLLEEAYAQTDGDAATFRRKDLAQLLNNWNAEITRAAGWKKKAGRGWAARRVDVGADVAPEGWSEALRGMYPAAESSLEWADLSADVKASIREFMKKNKGAE